MLGSPREMVKSVLVFCPYYPPHIGGLESHAEEFNKCLIDLGKKVVVFTPNLPVGKETNLNSDNLEIIRFPAFELIPNWPVPRFWEITFWKLFLGLFNQDFDLVISRTRFFITSILALVYAKIKRRKWMHIEHGSDFIKLTSPVSTILARGYDEVIGRLIFRLSDVNVPISRAVDKFIGRFDSRERVVIYRGINFSAIDDIKKDVSFAKKYKGYVKLIWVGRLYKWKGVELSIKAVAGLPQKIKDKIVFIIIGNGEDFGRLSLKKNKNIIFLGYKERKEAISIIKNADIYLHSSYPGGGLSTSLLEAMSCGVCPIACPNEGADEIVVNQKNGFLVSFEDTDKVKGAILDLVNSGLFKKFGEEAKKTTRLKFKWQASINKYEKLFNNLYS